MRTTVEELIKELHTKDPKSYVHFQSLSPKGEKSGMRNSLQRVDGFVGMTVLVFDTVDQ
jgi:hypothetical protein